jgi:hypothetical protein
MTVMGFPPRSRPRLAALLLLLGAGGCAGASREGAPSAAELSFRAKAVGWIGKSEQELVRALGEPNSSIVVPSGETFDEYRDAGCAITFRIDSERVVSSVVWKGDCAHSD